MNIYLKRVVVVIERVKGQSVCCPLLAFFHVVVRVHSNVAHLAVWFDMLVFSNEEKEYSLG